MLRRILDFFWSPCPSGLPHRTRWGVVENIFGKRYCWHCDCVRANFKECGVLDITAPGVKVQGGLDG
jgi:hypothetical protein